MSVTNTTCTVQPDNALRFNCTVTTDAPADVYVKFGPDDTTTTVCQAGRQTRTSLNSTTHNLVVYGMKPSRAYNVRAFAAAPGGTNFATHGVCGTTTTGTLPVGADTANLGHIQITTSVGSGTRDVRNFLTHYGCHGGDETATGSRDAFVILDSDGEIVWYQQPSLDLQLVDEHDNVTIEGMSLSRPDKHVLGLVNHDMIMEYDLEGNLLHHFCRDDGTSSGYCPLTTTAPDLFFESYVHHDVQYVGGTIYALSARQSLVHDHQDCDADSDTTELTPIILDGLYGFNVTGTPTQTVDWTWEDAGVPVDYEDGHATRPCSSGYWGDLAGTDYLHTNSFWLDSANQWMFSIHNGSQLWWVDRDTSSLFFNTVVATLDGDDVDPDDFSFVAGGVTENFYGQHTAHWGPDADLTLFDNQYDESPSNARAVVYDIDAGAGTVSATHEYTLKDTSGNEVECNTGGSGFGMLGGHYYAICPKTVHGDNTIFNEFYQDDAAGSPIAWTAQMQCDGPDWSLIDTAYRAYGNVW